MFSGSAYFRPEPFWYQRGVVMTLWLLPEIESELKQAAEAENRSVQQTVLAAIEEYLSARETAEILADPAALRGLTEARESVQDTAAVVVDFMINPLLSMPHQMGKPLREDLGAFRSAHVATAWRVLSQIDESRHTVIVHDIQHRPHLRGD